MVREGGGAQCMRDLTMSALVLVEAHHRCWMVWKWGRGEVVIVIKRIEGQCFCGEVSHINVTPRSQHRRDIRRQGNFIHLPPSVPKECLHLAALCNYSLIFFTKIFKLVWREGLGTLFNIRVNRSFSLNAFLNSFPLPDEILVYEREQHWTLVQYSVHQA